MISKTHLPHLLFAAFMVALLSSCNEPEQSTQTGASPGVGPVSGTDHKGANRSQDTPMQTAQTQNRLATTSNPALNLSIRGLTDNDAGVEDIIDADRHLTDSTEQQAQKLARKKTDEGVKLSGKIFTDQAMIENKQYLDSVDGIQVNIEGNFR
jgi:hypothetical protein